MEDGFRLQETQIAIVGLGLMGGSLALALQGKCAALYGVDPDPATLELARAREIVDQAERDPGSLLSRADLVILAAPVPAILRLIPQIGALVREGCILLDLGSTKREIVAAMSALPGHVLPIGGHPICGKERLGLENAEAGLYQGAPFVITPLSGTTRRAREAAGQIVAAIGAQLIEMTAEEHDQALAFTSHLPFLLSTALAACIPMDYAPLTGTGFRSTSRLAGTPSSIMLGILQSNRQHILDALSVFQQQLSEIQQDLAADDLSTLKARLDRSRSAYQSLVSPA